MTALSLIELVLASYSMNSVNGKTTIVYACLLLETGNLDCNDLV